jgi:polyisoprenoid-binding protein YceI
MNRLPIFLAIAVLSAFATGCANPAKDAPKAIVGQPSAQVVQAPASKVITVNLDPTNTSIGFVGSKVTGNHEGSFSRFKGTLKITDGKRDTASTFIEIDMDSLVIEPEKLAEHLKSADFFDVATFPKAVYKSGSMLTGAPPAPATDLVQGDLTLKGVNKGLSFPATIMITASRVMASAKFSINRKDFGLVYPGMPDDLIRDEVLIKLKVDAPVNP